MHLSSENLRRADPFVAAIIPNWNGKNFVLNCLQSLSELDYAPERLQIIVVDNGSSDGSQWAIRECFEKMRESGFEHLQLIENRMNLGAPAAYNQAIQCVHLECEFIWKLDNDVTVNPHCLWCLVDVFMGINGNEVGVAGGRFINTSLKTDEPIGARFERGIRRWSRIVNFVYPDPLAISTGSLEQIDMVSGGCCLIRRTAIRQDGIFDERFFLYYDDTEFCLRLRKSGWRMFTNPRAIAYHHGGSSTIAVPACRLYYWLRNHLLLGKCYFADVERLLFYGIHILNLPWKFIRIGHTYADGDYLIVAKTMYRAYYDFVIGRFGQCPEEFREKV